MSTFTEPTVGTYLDAALRAGEPDVHGPLAVFPLYGPEPALDYTAFAPAGAEGVRVTEVAGGASVGDLQVVNPTGRAVLLYEGEEVLGARQNRTFDVSVLVPPASRLAVPVSCVEQGRWEARREHEPFAPAPQAAHPALRRRKNEHAARAVAAGGPARADQREVWAEVEAKRSRLGSVAPTGALHDVYASRRGELAQAARAIRLHPGQQGALVALGGRFDVLDRVSRPEVWAALHGPLVQGYALDALECAAAGEPPATADAQRFLDDLAGLTVRERDGIGLGRDVRFSGAAAAGAGLVSGDELVQLTAFAPLPAGAPPQARIGRPSRRRRT